MSNLKVEDIVQEEEEGVEENEIDAKAGQESGESVLFKKGWLIKKGKGMSVNLWKRRYFRLYKASLIYYNSDTEIQPIGFEILMN